MKRVALYPGSFDPFTLGHLDIAARLANLYDEVVVAVLVNPAKTPFLPAEARVSAICEATRHLPNVRVMSAQGATVELARRVGARVLARGLRSVTDFEYENALAAGNRYLAPEIETVFLPARPEHGAISSSLVREMLALGGDVGRLVPPAVLAALKEHEAGKETKRR